MVAHSPPYPQPPQAPDAGVAHAAPGSEAVLEGWCRGCAAPLPRLHEEPKAPGRCPACASPKLVYHAEINCLSIAHLDCDAFYAAVEKRDDPSLHGQPVIIGGGQRGVVATACYLARAFGVRSAMPMFKARAACPDAVVIKPNMAKYAAESRRIRAILDSATPLVEMISIDEGFLDLAGTERLHGASPALTLVRLQRQIASEVGISVSVGLSFNRFLAKIASERDKPNGFAVIGRAEAVSFLAGQPVTILPGVGPAMAARLARDGLQKIGDLARRPDAELARRYGDMGLRLARLARAEDARPVRTDAPRKSVSSETTLAQDLSDPAALEAVLWRVCLRTADRAKSAGVCGRAVTLKVKTARFRSLTRRTTLAQPSQLADVLFEISRPLLLGVLDDAPFRLIGVGLADLSPAGDAGDTQARLGDLLSAADPQAPRREARERAMDGLRARFGDDAIVKGRSFKPAAKDDPESA